MDELNKLQFLPFVLALTLLIFCSLQILYLLRQKNYIVLLIWPVLIYLIGPSMSIIFEEHPTLSRYINLSRVNFLTFQMFWYVELLIIFGAVFNLSDNLRKSLSGSRLRSLSSSSLFPLVFLLCLVSASALQIHLLINVGSIFTGSYVLDNLADSPITYWGFLAGLYEIIFLCLILLLLDKKNHKKMWNIYIGAYLIATFLRVLGGTRLVIIKETIFILIFLYLLGSIKLKQLFFWGCSAIILGTVIGLLRGGGGDPLANIFGPVYGLVMESALNALTLSISDTVSNSGFIYTNGNIFNATLFFLVNLIPSFLRFGITEKDIESINPTSLAVNFGFDTSSPVGGMSGFATINYLTSYPLTFIFFMTLIFAFFFRIINNTAFKEFLSLLIIINCIHFWRDPSEIAFKLLFQGMFIMILLYYTRKNSFFKDPVKSC